MLSLLQAAKMISDKGGDLAILSGFKGLGSFDKAKSYVNLKGPV